MYFISQSNFVRLLELLKKNYSVHVPVRSPQGKNQIFWKKYTADTKDFTLGEVRACEPLKNFYFSSKELVSKNFSDEVPVRTSKPIALVGVKNCDLQGFVVTDSVFKGEDYQDPYYVRNREDYLIISSDCTSAIDTCFCAALGVENYPTKYFDVNLSTVDGGYVVESGSGKGEGIIRNNQSLFQDAPAPAIKKRQIIRDNVKSDVQKNIRDTGTPDKNVLKDIVKKNYDSDVWKQEAKNCVECGACNFICPNCHCFLLADQKDNKDLARFRLWDSCMLKNYARVAGGANPRHHLWERLRNRFEKKFDFFPAITGEFACTGCGRCISGCPAKIDIRKVLKKLI